MKQRLHCNAKITELQIFTHETPVAIKVKNKRLKMISKGSCNL